MSTPSQVESIFLDALEKKTTADRADYLDHACGDDAELRRQVERLLEAHAQAADFMARPAVERPEDDAIDREPHPPGLRPDPDSTCDLVPSRAVTREWPLHQPGTRTRTRPVTSAPPVRVSTNGSTEPARHPTPTRRVISTAT